MNCSDFFFYTSLKVSAGVSYLGVTNLYPICDRLMVKVLISSQVLLGSASNAETRFTFLKVALFPVATCD